MRDLLQELSIPRDKAFFISADRDVVLINDDFLKVDYIKPNSIDLIVTSPPYNVDVHYEGYKDRLPYRKYLEFTEKWLRKAYELLRPDDRTTLVAARLLKRRAIGIDISKKYCEIAKERLIKESKANMQSLV